MRYLCKLALASVGLLAWATTCVAEEPAPWFDIELIIFSQENSDAQTSEIWPLDAGWPETATATPLQPALETSSGLVAPFTFLPEEQWRLQDEFSRLKRSGQFSPLLHMAWRQPVVDAASAPTILLQTEVAPDTLPRLEGTVKISLSRYLHASLDIVLRAQTSSLEPGDGISMLGSTAHYYRLTDNRRMRSEELHYIDHPMMGAVILITRSQLPKPEMEVSDTPVKSDNGATPASPVVINNQPAPQN